jgi:putative transposase
MSERRGLLGYAPPPGWKDSIKSAVLSVIGLAHYALAQARGQASATAHRRDIDNDRLRQEVALLREELRIKDVRMSQTAPHRRPHYPPPERLAILELRAVRGWSLAQTARAFLVTAATIADWMRRIDEPGDRALVQLRESVNKFPEFVGFVVQRLKVLCPAMGKRKIAETLARAGLHLGATTVGRMLAAPPQSAPKAPLAPNEPRVVTAKRPNHVWHVDLTTTPVGSGFWAPWPPPALPQRWPFCWWIAVVVDHYSRRAMGSAVFHCQPTSEEIRAFLVGRTIARVGATPKHLICDRGPQFDCRGFRRWCRRRKIKPRYGAVGQHGAIAIVERFIRTLKGGLRRLVLVPMGREAFRREINHFIDWYNESRPHTALGGNTPNEVYFNRFPACRRPRFEPRANWSRGSPCAAPWALTRGRPGAELELDVTFHVGRKHLPIVALRRVG